MVKLQEQVSKAENKVQALGKKFLTDAAIVIAQNLRGTLCAICGDPDVKNTIFDPATKTWYVNQAAMDDYILKISEAFKSTSGNGKECLENIMYNKDKFEKDIGACAAAEKLLNDLKAKLTPCEGDACTTTAKSCFNPLGTTCVDSLTQDTTANSSRRELAASYQPTATGGAKSSTDATEDGSLEVGGETASNINTNANTAQTEYTTAGGAVDYKAVAAAE